MLRCTLSFYNDQLFPISRYCWGTSCLFTLLSCSQPYHNLDTIPNVILCRVAELFPLLKIFWDLPNLKNSWGIPWLVTLLGGLLSIWIHCRIKTRLITLPRQSDFYYNIVVYLFFSWFWSIPNVNRQLGSILSNYVAELIPILLDFWGIYSLSTIMSYSQS